ncbi:helix-turn-helix transcriptional regulator [Tabrizicola sp.]|uniref:helix-turn-helix transcriptional regulator n=1 Tax=Tabrizicola sp. TaxID=2005166 RepID=UPI00286B2A7A|nr:helix-turn-helix transcriptional regulator [Tabrizicola sp.]
MTPATWVPLAAAVVASLDSPALPQSLADLLRQVAPFTYTVVFGYRGADRPVDLYDDFPHGKRQIFVTDYQAGPYLLDPFYQAALRPVPPGLYRLRDLAPDRFYQGEYFRNYYAQTGLAEEIAFFVDLPHKTIAVLSLMRAERPFSQKEFAAFSALYPFVAAVAKRQWTGLATAIGEDASATESEGLQKRVAYVFGSFGDGILTPREREVAEFTLKGHSAESVGQLLQISPGTVRIHRRNIYSKLRINSQGELFSRFLGTLVDLT